MKILIAEDDPVGARIIKRILARENHEVTVTSDGVEALEALRKERFDILFSDWLMPNMDGIELVRRVRAMVDPSPAIIMITTIASPKAESHAIASGADAYIAKPYSPQDVLKVLEAYAGGKDDDKKDNS